MQVHDGARRVFRFAETYASRELKIFSTKLVAARRHRKTIVDG
jgi:hypothetical protein